MSLAWRRPALLVLPLLVTVGACSVLEPTEGESPLEKVSMPPQSCALDIFFVRYRLGDEEANVDLWNQVDEQQLANDVRRELTRNGFRVGVLGGQMPTALARLLELEGKPVASGPCQQVSLEALESAPRVVRHHVQVRPGRPRQIVAAGIQEEFPVILATEEGVCGRSYHNAQPLLTLTAFPEPDGRTRLELVPELHHGDYVQRYAGHQYAFRIEGTRPRRVFEETAFCASLNAGDMLLIGGLANRPGSLGNRFFTHEISGRKEQKLLIIRLSQTQNDPLFCSLDSPPAVDPEAPIGFD
jgi:hypothetical protein